MSVFCNVAEFTVFYEGKLASREPRDAHKTPPRRVQDLPGRPQDGPMPPPPRPGPVQSSRISPSLQQTEGCTCKISLKLFGVAEPPHGDLNSNTVMLMFAELLMKGNGMRIQT